jgi:hypothetical protein
MPVLLHEVPKLIDVHLPIAVQVKGSECLGEPLPVEDPSHHVDQGTAQATHVEAAEGLRVQDRSKLLELLV